MTTNSKPKVTVIGLGYVGLPLVLALARSRKYDVHGYDIDDAKLDSLKEGINPLKDESATFLDGFIKDVTYFGSDEIDNLKNTKFFLITVPTPIKDDNEPDYSCVTSAGEAIAPYIEKGSYVVLESTVNPGTCDEILTPVLEKGSGLKVGKDFSLSHCPERINPGDTKWNILNIPRNVGSCSEEDNKVVADFYRSFLEGAVNEVSSLKFAEATKIVENTFRDVNIAFVNELAMSFDKLGIDVLEVIKGSSNKPFGFLPHFPGAGVGGHCIPVDPYFLIKRAALNGFDHKFLKTAREINNGMPAYTVKLLENGVGEAFDSKDSKSINVGVLGLSYKANIGDVRESPAIEIYNLLEKEGHPVKYFDPHIDSYKDMNSVESLEALLGWADALILVTMHREFNVLPGVLAEHPNVKVLVDGRNAFKASDFSNSLVYRGIGTNKDVDLFSD